MEHFQSFLETSTIHGLSWISSTRRFSRFLWVVIVISGFSTAGYLIYSSFNNWNESPISTTIETLPISQITFPNVTICPPRNSYLNLNYDLVQSEKLNLSNEAQNEILEFAREAITDAHHEEVMTNLSKMEDPNRYYNWYHGYTEISYPKHDSMVNKDFYIIKTTATSGNISTKFFGNILNTEKVDTNLVYQVEIHVPQDVKGDKSRTLWISIDKKTFNNLEKKDFVYIKNSKQSNLPGDQTHYRQNFTGPDPKDSFFAIGLERTLTKEDIRDIKTKNIVSGIASLLGLGFVKMPGFRLQWFYDTELKNWAEFSDTTVTKEFVRYNHFF